MEDLDSQSDLDMTKVMPSSATRNARGASGRTWSRSRGGGAEGSPPTLSVSSGRANFGGINGSSSRSSDDSRTRSDSSNSNNSRDLPAPVSSQPRDL